MKKIGIIGLLAAGFWAGCGNKPGGNAASSADSVQTAEKPVANPTDFAGFWTHFRSLVLDKKYSEIAKYTVFPLQTRGSMDDQPILTYTAGEFEKLFPLFLASPTGLSTDFNETQLDYIKARPTLTFRTDGKIPSLSADGKKAEVSAMKFEQRPEGWRLVFLYLEDDVYQKTGRNPI